MSSNTEFPWQQPNVCRHSQRLILSFQHLLGRPLIASDDDDQPLQIAQRLFEAPFVLISHGIEADPIFNYGNRRALEFWQMNWDEFVRMPSRKTAEPVEPEERDRLLAQTQTVGFCHFQAVRITPTG